MRDKLLILLLLIVLGGCRSTGVNNLCPECPEPVCEMPDDWFDLIEEVETFLGSG